MEKHLVYPSLARPQMIAGIPMDYLMWTLPVVGVFWPITQNIFAALAAAVVVWGYGWYRARRDPEFLAVLIVKNIKLRRTASPFGRWSGNRYRP